MFGSAFVWLGKLSICLTWETVLSWIMNSVTMATKRLLCWLNQWMFWHISHTVILKDCHQINWENFLMLFTFTSFSDISRCELTEICESQRGLLQMFSICITHVCIIVCEHHHGYSVQNCNWYEQKCGHIIMIMSNRCWDGHALIQAIWYSDTDSISNNDIGHLGLGGYKKSWVVMLRRSCRLCSENLCLAV